MRARALAAGMGLSWAVLTASGIAQAADGPWVWPLEGPHAVGRAFDPPATRYGPGHRGADLPGQVGQPVRAAGAGRISYAGLLAGRGVVVVVHGELRTTYEPVTAVVPVGRQVIAGKVIGRLEAGHPGCTPACLHWGLLRGEIYLDPVRLVRRGPSRLLPLDGQVAGQVSGQLPDPTLRTSRVTAAPAATPAPLPPRAAREPRFALRAGDAAAGGAALIALVAGLMLVRRPPRPPDRPVAPALVAPGAGPAHAPPMLSPQTSGLVDLASERHRRRPEVA